MLAINLLCLLLPALASAANLSPAIALENRFKQIHDEHRRNKTDAALSAPVNAPGVSKAAAVAETDDVAAFGDILKPNPSNPPDSNVIMTRNELLEGKCAPIIVIFARGTTEPGNVGDDVGPSFFDALLKLRPGKVVIQGVNNYKADIWGYLAGGSEEGAQDMAKSVDRAVRQCPQSKIVLSGFSQGAQVTHKAASKIDPKLYKFIGAIVLFGDPFNGDDFPGTLNNNVKTFCHEGDLICDGLPIPTPEHSTYENDGPAAAAYVAARM